MNIIRLQKKIVCISFLLAPMLEHLCCLSTVMHCLLMTRVISASTDLVSDQIRANMFTITDCSTRVHSRPAEDDESKSKACCLVSLFHPISDIFFSPKSVTISFLGAISPDIEVCSWWPSSSVSDTGVVSVVEAERARLEGGGEGGPTRLTSLHHIGPNLPLDRSYHKSRLCHCMGIISMKSQKAGNMKKRKCAVLKI